MWLDIIWFIFLGCLLHSESENFLLSSNFGTFWLLYFKMGSASFSSSFWNSDYTHKWNLDITVSQVCEALVSFFFFNIFSLQPNLITSINSTSGSLYLSLFDSILLMFGPMWFLWLYIFFLSCRMYISFF